jgi:hypothetical protein
MNQEREIMKYILFAILAIALWPFATAKGVFLKVEPQGNWQLKADSNVNVRALMAGYSPVTKILATDQIQNGLDRMMPESVDVEYDNKILSLWLMDDFHKEFRLNSNGVSNTVRAMTEQEKIQGYACNKSMTIDFQLRFTDSNQLKLLAHVTTTLRSTNLVNNCQSYLLSENLGDTKQSVIALAVNDGFLDPKMRANYYQVRLTYQFFGTRLSKEVGLLPVCTSEAIFTELPIDLGNISHIEPMGGFNSSQRLPNPTIHFVLNRGKDGVTSTSKVFAPGNIRLKSVERSRGRGVETYTIRFKACREVETYIRGLSTIDDQIASQLDQSHADCQYYSSGGSDYELCRFSTKQNIAAGSYLGLIGGGTWDSLDIGSQDTRKVLNLVHPNYYYDEYRNAACTIDYMSSDLRTKLSTLLGAEKLQRTAEPVCGRLDHDLAGTARGGWFKATNLRVGDDNLALAPHNVDPNYQVLAVGNGINGLNSDAYAFVPAIDKNARINQAFENIKPGFVYCYQNLGSIQGGIFNGGYQSQMPVVLKLLSNNKLQIAVLSDRKTCGTANWKMPATATTFVR